MLNRVYANGFRSLDDFSLAIKPGLNVLIGPNGGGKTNILSLFSFISALTVHDVGDAIGTSGGASKVFKKLSSAVFEKTITIIAEGEMPFDRSLYLPSAYERRLIEAGFVSLHYEWSFIIDSSLGYDEPFYSQQSLKGRVSSTNLFVKEDLQWHFEINVTSENPQSHKFAEYVHDEYPALLVGGITTKEYNEAGTIFIHDIEENYGAHSPIFYSLTSAHIVRRLTRDLRSGVTFNFDPAVCKKPNDSAQSPSLGKTGDGLAATIYAIQKSQEASPRGAIYAPRRRYDPRIYKSLQEYFKLINSTVGNVRARNSAMDNRITVYFTVKREETVVDFPIELASDGTVKWLAFTVALLTESSGFSLEEPENFLHPDIQRHAIELIRTETEGSVNSYVLLTTHSETLLNTARPDEIVVVSMENAITAAKRLEDPDLLNEEIERTGFGLGYYYISGALND